MYYCDVAGMTEPIICPVGKYCAASTITPLDCPVGYYNDLEGQDLLADCAICPPGRYCDSLALDFSGENCDAGYGCYIDGVTPISTANPNGQICPDGTYSTEGSAVCTFC